MHQEGHLCGVHQQYSISQGQSSVMQAAQEGELQLLYVAPERFRSKRFLDVLRSVPIDHLP